MRSFALRATVALLTFSAGALAAAAFRSFDLNLAGIVPSLPLLLAFSAASLGCHYVALAGDRPRRYPAFTVLMLCCGFVTAFGALLVALLASLGGD